MLLAVVLSIFTIASALNTPVGQLIGSVFSSESSSLFVWDWHSKFFFPKQFFGGMFIAITMTGLDQEMMQKNISCKNIGEAQKNMFTFSGILLFVNLMFLVLGAILLTYVAAQGIELPKKSDDLFPMIALNFLGPISGIVFIIGLISAAYPSADGALTALTTSFCIDILGIQDKQSLSEAKRKKIRHAVHIGFAVLLLLVIVLFRIINNDAVVNMVFKVANYTYGPLLGLFAFGLFNRHAIRDKWVPIACLLAPCMCYVISENSKTWLGGYEFGNELLILNGALTFGLLFIVIDRKSILMKL
jgi:Na+/proline symporter